MYGTELYWIKHYPPSPVQVPNKYRREIYSKGNCSKALQGSGAMRDTETSCESDFIPIVHMQKHKRKWGAEE